VNTKERGDIAVGQAISFYLGNGYEVCLPVGDKRHYDLIVEKNNVLQRVQVKYAGFYNRNDRCRAGLRITGGNQSYNYAKKYTDEAFDTLFVYTERGERYTIPWKELKCRTELTIDDKKYTKYRVR
jgi:hypothetical protein